MIPSSAITSGSAPAAAGAEPAAGRLHVGSEIGRLRRVILHRPDLELRRLTPRNKDELLFDDVLWVRRARQEHDAFADALAERGVEVLYLHELLGETLDIPAARDEVLLRTTDQALLGPSLGPAVEEWLRSLPGRELAMRLIGGIAYDELPFESQSLGGHRAGGRRFRTAAAAEPSVHARHVGVGLRGRDRPRDGKARA